MLRNIIKTGIKKKMKNDECECYNLQVQCTINVNCGLRRLQVDTLNCLVCVVTFFTSY